MLTIKSSQKLLFIAPRVEGVVQNLHLQVFIYVLNQWFSNWGSRTIFGGVASRYFMYLAVLHLLY